MAASSVQRVIYCDFHFQQAQITPQVKAFLQELAQVTGWSLLFVEQQQVWSDGKRLGALPRAGSWQEQIQYALTLSDPQMVFIWFDDLVAKPWHRGKVARLFDQAERLLEREQPTPTDYVRLNPNPPVTGLPMADKKFRLIGSNEAYIVLVARLHLECGASARVHQSVWFGVESRVAATPQPGRLPHRLELALLQYRTPGAARCLVLWVAFGCFSFQPTILGRLSLAAGEKYDPLRPL